MATEFYLFSEFTTQGGTDADLVSLEAETRAADSGLDSKLDYTEKTPVGAETGVTFTFSSALTAPEQTALDGVVAAHPGTVTEAPSMNISDGNEIDGQIYVYDSTLEFPGFKNATMTGDASIDFNGAITINNFTDAEDGFAPASGGGTTNFLRADGTWAVPPGGGGSPLTTKGDLFTFDTGDARLPVGVNGQILQANSAEATGLEWVNAAGGGDVSGPGSSTDNQVVRWDGATGTLIQGESAGSFTYDDTGVVSIVAAVAPNSHVFTIQNTTVSGELFAGFNHLGNIVFDINCNGSGDGVFRIRDGTGVDISLEVDVGVAKIGAGSSGVDFSWPLTVQGDLTGNGLQVRAGEIEGDIVFHLADQDDSFKILEVHADQGQMTLGKTYAQTLLDNGVVYGIDQQGTGLSKDFNTQVGAYRGGGEIWLDGPSHAHFEEVSSEAKSTTTSTTYQTKINYTTASLPAGDYMVTWHCEVDQTNTADRTQVLVQADGQTLGNPQMETGDINDQNPFSGFRVITIAAGTVQLLMQWREQAGSTAGIERARMAIWRVG